MKLLPDQEKVKTLLSDTIKLLCKNGLNYTDEFCIEALIGITVDKNHVFLVNINETIPKDVTRKTGTGSSSSSEYGGSKIRKRRPLISHDRLPGLINGDRGTTLSRPKIPRLNQSRMLSKPNYHKVPIVRKDLESKLTKKTEEVFRSDGKGDTFSKLETSNVFPTSTVSDDHTDEHYNRTELTHNSNNSDKPDTNCSPTALKQESAGANLTDNQDNTHDLAMQLLYPQSDNAEESNANNTTTTTTDHIEHQITGPPVWPEPTLSLSSGLTLPTVIAPSSSSTTTSVGGETTSPQTAEESSGQASQVGVALN